MAYIIYLNKRLHFWLHLPEAIIKPLELKFYGVVLLVDIIHYKVILLQIYFQTYDIPLHQFK